MSSVYLWDLEDGKFAGVVLLKKGVLFPIFYDHFSDSPHLSDDSHKPRRALGFMGLDSRL